MPDLDVRICVSLPDDADGKAATQAAQRAVFLLAVEVIRASANWNIDGVNGKVRRRKR